MTLWTWVLLATLVQISSAQKPNVIFILVDDLGWNDVSFHGNTEIPTPNIDTMASDGIMLNNYYVAPLCTPSRASLMTGFYPANTGLQNNVIQAAGPWGLPLNFRLFPQYMADLGYTCRMVGKWHLGFYKSDYTPTARGFESHYGFWGPATDHFEHTGHNLGNVSEFENVPANFKDHSVSFAGVDFRDDYTPVTNREGEYLADIYTQKAEEIIRDHDESHPLFMYLAHHGVHRGNWLLPIRAPLEYTEGFEFIDNYTRQQFAGAVTSLDQSVGRIFAALNDKGLLSNSIIVFSTDNGADQVTFTSNAGSNWPLKGQKFTNWEGGVRGVGVVWSPLLQAKSRISDQMMHISDWLPTIYDAAGGDLSNLDPTMDGMSMWDALSENLPSPRNVTLINVDSIYKMGALRVGDYKILYGSVPFQDLNQWFGPTARSSVAPYNFRSYSLVRDVLRDLYRNQSLTFDSKVVNVICGKRPTSSQYFCDPDVAPCLFNLRHDPCEYYNVAREEPDIFRDMLDTLLRFNATAHTPLNTALSFDANPVSHNGLWTNWGDKNEL